MCGYGVIRDIDLMDSARQLIDPQFSERSSQRDEALALD